MKKGFLVLAAFLLGLSSEVLLASDVGSSEDVARAASQIAVRAIMLRDEGWSRDRLLQVIQDEPGLPESIRNETRKIVDDIYTHPEVMSRTYFAYMRVSFHRAAQGLPVPRDFGQIAVPIIACQRPDAPQESEALVLCVMEAFKALDGDPSLSVERSQIEQSSAPHLSEKESEVISAAGIDPSVAVRVKQFGYNIEQLMALTADYSEVPAAGIVVSVAPASGRDVLSRVRSELVATEYRAYLRADASGAGPDKIAIVKSDDLGFLAIVRPEGINHGIESEEVLERYAQWNKRYGLELVGAGQDWLEATFKRPPSDWQAFAAEVYEFCPDVVDQGSGDVEALAEDMRVAGRVYLWWD